MAFSNRAKALAAAFMVLFIIIVYVVNAKETVPAPGTPITATMRDMSVAPYPEGLENYNILTIKYVDKKKFFAQTANEVDGGYKIPAFRAALDLAQGKALSLGAEAPLIALALPNTQPFGFTSTGILRPFKADNSVYKQPEVKDSELFPAVPFKFSADFGGNSAALAVSLMWYEILTPGNLSNGKKVYATGELTNDGSVKDVEYTQEKVKSALSANADIILVPESYGGTYDPKIVKVGTLKQAVEAIRALNSR